jgi:hypothetical protein
LNHHRPQTVIHPTRLPTVLVAALILSAGFSAPAGGETDPAPGEDPAGVETPEPETTSSSSTASLVNRASVAPFPPYGVRQWKFDTRTLITRPRHWDRRSWVRVSGVAGTTVALYLLRDEIREIVQRNRSDSRTGLFDDVRTMGKGAFAPSLALVAWLSSYATGNDREKETALLLMESWAYSAATAWTGSFVLAAERPNEGDSVTLFSTDGHGVSLDAALAASVIRPLHRQYLRVKPDDGPGRKIWKRTALGLLYTGAGLTAYQRLDADDHWAPDVFLGTWTGLTVGKNLNRAHDAAAGGGAVRRHRFEVAGTMVRWTINLDRRPPSSR